MTSYLVNGEHYEQLSALIEPQMAIEMVIAALGEVSHEDRRRLSRCSSVDQSRHRTHLVAIQGNRHGADEKLWGKVRGK